VALERFDEATDVLASAVQQAADTPVSLESWYVPANRLLGRLRQIQNAS
jgi:hypothetical protein